MTGISKYLALIDIWFFEKTGLGYNSYFHQHLGRLHPVLECLVQIPAALLVLASCWVVSCETADDGQSA